MTENASMAEIKLWFVRALCIYNVDVDNWQWVHVRDRITVHLCIWIHADCLHMTTIEIERTEWLFTS